MTEIKKDPYESYEFDDLNQLKLDTDTSDTSSVIDDFDYLSDEEINNNYSFIQKSKKKLNNQYKEQFKLSKTTLKKELEEETYISD